MRLISDVRWRISPGRNSPLAIGSIGISSASEIIRATSRIVVATPLPTFTGRPSSASVVAASKLARAMSSTKHRSRVCSPSSYSTGGWPLGRRGVENSATPAWGGGNDRGRGRGAEAVDMAVLRDLGHVAAIGRLVKHHVDVAQHVGDRGAIADVGRAELGRRGHPGWLAVAVRLRLQVIEDANLPALAQQQV